MMITRPLSRVKAAVSHRARPLQLGAIMTVRGSALRRQMEANITYNRPKNNLRVMHFSNSVALYDGIIPVMGDNSKSIDKAGETLLQAAQISKEDYEEIADKTLDTLSAALEETQEQKGNLDVEYSSGILKIELPTRGTWVINKQPPNKQIWLSSPESGPKRFDWVVTGESMHQKEGGGSGDWIYLRDGTSLSSVVKKELGVDIAADVLSP